jgi:hypothetical protein
MPSVVGPVDADQENAFQHVFNAAIFMMETWDVTLHFVISSCLGKLLR